MKAAIDAANAHELRRLLTESPALADESVVWGEREHLRTHPLHYVCDKLFDGTIRKGDELPLIEALLAAGADCNGHAEDRETPLHGAASLGAEDVGVRLLDAGADPNRLGSFAETPLHWAAHLGLAGLVGRLLQAGAKTDIVDKRYNATPLGWAQHGLTNRPPGSGGEHERVIEMLGG
jgi:uncharacterized protein